MGGREYLGCLGLLAVAALIAGASGGAVLGLVASKFVVGGILLLVVGAFIFVVLASDRD